MNERIGMQHLYAAAKVQRLFHGPARGLTELHGQNRTDAFPSGHEAVAHGGLQRAACEKGFQAFFYQLPGLFHLFVKFDLFHSKPPAPDGACINESGQILSGQWSPLSKGSSCGAPSGPFISLTTFCSA